MALDNYLLIETYKSFHAFWLTNFLHYLYKCTHSNWYSVYFNRKSLVLQSCNTIVNSVVYFLTYNGTYT